MRDYPKIFIRPLNAANPDCFDAVLLEIFGQRREEGVT